MPSLKTGQTLRLNERARKTVEDAIELLKVDFECAKEIDGVKLFRKR